MNGNDFLMFVVLMYFIHTLGSLVKVALETYSQISAQNHTYDLAALEYDNGTDTVQSE